MHRFRAQLSQNVSYTVLFLISVNRLTCASLLSGKFVTKQSPAVTRRPSLTLCWFASARPCLRRGRPGTFFKSTSAPVLPPCSVAQTSSRTKNRPGGLLPSRSSTTTALLK
ncbi:hypothetical protein PUN28_001259 [Cardiocondyla obscurior]|uniref:Secreted protein n=1 Tax=Cardiocondyla obscurior TaxID=286306 RepID=A0AAW2H430_9HYME